MNAPPLTLSNVRGMFYRAVEDTGIEIEMHQAERAADRLLQKLRREGLVHFANKNWRLGANVTP